MIYDFFCKLHFYDKRGFMPHIPLFILFYQITMENNHIFAPKIRKKKWYYNKEIILHGEKSNLSVSILKNGELERNKIVYYKSLSDSK